MRRSFTSVQHYSKRRWWLEAHHREKKRASVVLLLFLLMLLHSDFFFIIIMFSCTNAPRAESLFLPRTRKRSYGRQTFEQMIWWLTRETMTIFWFLWGLLLLIRSFSFLLLFLNGAAPQSSRLVRTLAPFQFRISSALQLFQITESVGDVERSFRLKITNTTIWHISENKGSVQ
jgi:hypothetical protein